MNATMSITQKKAQEALDAITEQMFKAVEEADKKIASILEPLARADDALRERKAKVSGWNRAALLQEEQRVARMRSDAEQRVIAINTALGPNARRIVETTLELRQKDAEIAAHRAARDAEHAAFVEETHKIGMYVVGGYGYY